MKNEKFNYFDSLNNKQAIDISSDDFKFVQQNTKIHDVVLQGKPTTFFKDAMHRFVKNKSSVCGGIILGAIVLFAIVLPIVIPNVGCYDVGTTHLLNNGGIKSEVTLPPKLFPSGTGFWDGTIKKTDISYDQENENPVGYENRTVSDIAFKESYFDYEGKYGEGGYLNFTTNTEKAGDSNGDLYSYTYDYDFDKFDYTFKYRFLKPTAEGYSASPYRISLITISGGVKTYYPLTGSDLNYTSFTSDNDASIGYINTFVSSSDSNTIDIDVDNIMAKYGITSLKGGRINIDVVRSTSSNAKGSIYIENLLIDSNDTNEDSVSLRGIRDANHCMIQEQKISDGSSIDVKDNPEYWKTTFGSRSCLNVKFVSCDFTYDPYEDCYGVKEMTLPSYKIQEWINSRIISYSAGDATSDESVISTRFKNLSSSSPIVKVLAQTGKATWSNVDKAFTGYYLICEVSQYKYLGYSSYPLYLFGTDGSGRDFLKTIATSLRYSLVIAISVSAINIVFGLIWGSISGYFGGWTDIILERLVDIIGGLPSIAIITLSLLHLHNDMLAFVISMFMTGWMGVSGRTRTQFYRFKGREYVLASRTLGARDSRLIFRHILPNSMGTIITSSILMIPSVIYSEASIAYLGLGLKSQLLFGVILSENRNYFSGYTLYLLVIPTIIMAFLLVSFNLFGNGLRDAFDPSLKGSE